MFFCYSFLTANAQQYSYKHYDIKDGLVGNNVYHSVQDKDGFLWFATETGISRFDGTNFKNFTTAEGLTDNEVLRLFVDAKNRVWIIPLKNELCYYYKGIIHNAHNDTVLSKMKFRNYVNGITENSNGDILFFEERGIKVLKENNDVLSKYTLRDSIFLTFGGGVNSTNEPFVYLESEWKNASLYKIKILNKNIELTKSDDDIIFDGNKVNYCDVRNDVFIYPNNRKDHFDFSTVILNNFRNKQIDTIQLPESFNTFNIVDDSMMYFNTGNGSLAYNFKQKRYKKKFIPNETVSCTIVDNESNLWFTTLGNGIFRLNSKVNQNISLIKNAVKNSVESIYATAGEVFVGTDRSGVFRFKSSKLDLQSVQSILDSLGSVIKMARYKDDLYILFDFSFYKLNLNTWKIAVVNICPVAKWWSYKDFEIDQSGNIVFCTHSNAFTFSPATGQCAQMLHERVTAVCIADEGTYFGTLKGLKYVNKKAEVFDLGKQFPLLGRRITKLLYNNKKVWVGTDDNGIICFNGEKIEKHLSVKTGLTGNLIRSLYAEKDNLWVGTDRGLNKINLTNTSYPVIRTYTSSEGLISDMVNTVFVIKDTVYVGSASGLNYFDERLIDENSICKFKLDAISVSGTRIAFDSSEIKLKNKDNNIRFDFVAISYKSDGKINYYYKLDGVDTAWKTTTQNSLEYQTLPSGAYTMQLFAINKFGVKSETDIIKFSIEKKLIEKSWFIISAALLFISLVWLIAYFEIRRVKKAQREKLKNAEKIARLEQQALKAQMNPHFIFNCLNSIQQYVIDKDVKGANKFISGFSKLIRQTLDNSGKQSISVSEEESFLRTYLELEKSRFENKFSYKISIDDKINKDEDSLPPMLLQPYIENCIRHGIMHKTNGIGLIEINFRLEKNNLVCKITDNGIGRKAAEVLKGKQHINYQSRGTELTGQRIKMMNKNNETDIVLKTEDLYDDNNNSCGTEVSIVIPLQYEA